MPSTLFFSYPIFIFIGLVCLVFYLYKLNNDKLNKIQQLQRDNLNCRHDISAITFLLQTVDEHRAKLETSSEPADDLFQELVKKILHYFVLEYSVVYLSSFDTISNNMRSLKDEDFVIDYIKKNELSILKSLTDEPCLFVATRQGGSNTEQGLYILRLLEDSAPNFIVFVKYFYDPLTTDKDEVLEKEFYKSLIPEEKAMFSGPIRSILLQSLKPHLLPLQKVSTQEADT